MNTNNSFKYFIIGIITIIGLLIIGAIFLNRPQFPDVLKEEQVGTFATEIYGGKSNEYLVYAYDPDCGACQTLETSEVYQNFINNPEIRMYKVTLNIIGTSNPVHPDLPPSFVNDVDLEYTPTIYHIRQKDGEYELVDTIVGVENNQRILFKYTD